MLALQVQTLMLEHYDIRIENRSRIQVFDKPIKKEVTNCLKLQSASGEARKPRSVEKASFMILTNLEM